MKGVQINDLPEAVRQGVKNHFAVDRFTDRHQHIQELKKKFNPEYGSCAGIAVDIAFDHFLIRHWDRFSSQAFENFTFHVYCEILKHKQLMHPAMGSYVRMLIRSSWLSGYETLSGVQFVLDRLGTRTVSPNRIADSFYEIERLYEDCDRTFLKFFPELTAFVDREGIETGGGGQQTA